MLRQNRTRLWIGIAALALIALALLALFSLFRLGSGPSFSQDEATLAALDFTSTPSATPPLTATAASPPIAPTGIELTEVAAYETEPGTGGASTGLPATATATPTVSPTPIVIAAAPVQIRDDVSGDVIGDGTIRVYAPASMQPAQSARIELELSLDNLYVTPTPQGRPGTPVPRATQVAGTSGATPTPYLPIITDQGLPVYQRMGATLLCSAQSFTGCDSRRDPAQARLITSRATTWSWIVTPAEAAAGPQDLRIEVWIVQPNLDGSLEYLDVPDAQYRFTIEVSAGGAFDPLLLALLAGAVVLVGGFVLWRGRRAAVPSPAALRPRAAGKPPLVFISYQRGSSWGQARSVEQSLRKRGADVFIDVDDINEGKFAETIQKAIAACDYFLPVLAPGTLESTWVRREIAYAIELKKTIVPLLIDGFRLDEASLPPEISEIASHNAITVLPEFYEEAMDRLAKRFLRLE